MKLSISNIAWNMSDNDYIYKAMTEKGFVGLEIAPTKIIPENTYDKIDEGIAFYNDINKNYGLVISSMQSIWYGLSGNIFNDEDSELLLEHTKRVILFANAINCKNLVFGSPKNRIITCDNYEEKGIEFFRNVSDFATDYDVNISIEPNPEIYGTDFLNNTIDTIDFIKKVDRSNIKLNYDLGSVIENQESLNLLEDTIEFVNHIHISEPYLKKIQKRDIHKDLFEILKKLDYNKFVSIEMGLLENADEVIEVINYIGDLGNE